MGHVGDALRRRFLEPEEAKLILLTRLADVPLTRLAVGSGRTAETLRRRRRAAEVRLRMAVA